MTPLERALRERIAAKGAITVEAYMEACNAYYYATRDPLGAGGDFTTAPEVSQIFGELIGACLADCWKRAGTPQDAIFAELGPGRGTLAADALRVLRSAGFAGAAHLVETSPVLRQAQAEAVPGACFHERIEQLPKVPLLLAANEFLDALPIRQFVEGKEREVMLAAGGLAFTRDGPVVETSPEREEAVRVLAGHLAQFGGVAILIDYGHAKSAPGDTLQAIRGHRFAPLLAAPGEQDLTAHVDFEVVARVARDAGVEVTPLVSQGQWLGRLGIAVRASELARANPERTDEISGALHRLVHNDEMGALFKVLALHAPGWPVPAGFE